MAEQGRDEAVERAELMLSLRRRGLQDRLVMRALELVPRERFVEPAFRALAWRDQALPLDCGQTVSQPSLVALITESLDVGSSHRVLEVGTGSGYQAAILGHLARSVVTLERFRTLAHAAALRLRALDLTNVDVVLADGFHGHLAASPYDRIVISAAVPEVPPALLAQLANDGVLIAPLGEPSGIQMLTRFTAGPQGVTRRELVPVRFVPLLKGVATVL